MSLCLLTSCGGSRGRKPPGRLLSGRFFAAKIPLGKSGIRGIEGVLPSRLRARCPRSQEKPLRGAGHFHGGRSGHPTLRVSGGCTSESADRFLRAACDMPAFVAGEGAGSRLFIHTYGAGMLAGRRHAPPASDGRCRGRAEVDEAARDLRYLDPRRYEHAARTLDGTGRKVGAWRKVHRAREETTSP